MQNAIASRGDSGTLRAAFHRAVAAAKLWLDAIVEGMSRSREVQRLDAMTDRQLAQLGITRNEIVRYVFRDKLNVN